MQEELSNSDLTSPPSLFFCFYDSSPGSVGGGLCSQKKTWRKQGRTKVGGRVAPKENWRNSEDSCHCFIIWPKETLEPKDPVNSVEKQPFSIFQPIQCVVSHLLNHTQECLLPHLLLPDSSFCFSTFLLFLSFFILFPYVKCEIPRWEERLMQTLQCSHSVKLV